jgi:hypothetical protein
MNIVKLKKAWLDVSWTPASIASALFILVWVAGFILLMLNRAPTKVAQPVDQQKFWHYIEQHSCRRVIWITVWFKNDPRYNCDNGWWREEELIEVANSRYPH